MNTYPCDPDTGVCLSGGVSVTGLARQTQNGTEAEDLCVNEVTGRSGKEDGNIGSIITMLITDQTVDLEEYLGDPLLTQKGGKVLMTSNIKQEETLSEAVSPSPSNSESAFQHNTEHDFYFTLSNDGYKSRTTSLSEGDDDNYRTFSSTNMYGNYDINNANVDMSSRHLYPPLGDMSNYARGCPEDSVKKDDKYWERRRKNNLAAKKSRDSRRIRENQMRLRVLCLENANQMLKEEIDRKDSEISRLKMEISNYENCHQMYSNQ